MYCTESAGLAFFFWMTMQVLETSTPVGARFELGEKTLKRHAHVQRYIGLQTPLQSHLWCCQTSPVRALTCTYSLNFPSSNKPIST